MKNVLSDNYQREAYKVAIYCRLSLEDDINQESQSITNQKNILTDYVLDKGWTIVDVYADDGYSGLNFDRPDFIRMLDDIAKGKVSLVIVKDMSRLGRDYIEVGYYVEKFFPENNVRFIALNDNIDTGKDLGNNDIAPFKAIINDMYSKDISKKVRSVFDSKRKQGKFIGAFAPFGYEKDSSDNNKLIIDPEAAVVVRRIFTMYLQGEGQTAIAKKLNSEGILVPALYKKKKYGTYSNGKQRVSKWSHGSVKSILKNPMYTGNMTQNKYKKVNYKSKKLKSLSQDDWIMIENTHQAIVSWEEFEQVQELMDSKKQGFTIARKEAKLFSGLGFCGDCGEYMTYYKTGVGNQYLICSGYKRFGLHHCSRHPILEEKLQDMILMKIRDMFYQFIDREQLEEEAKRMVSNKKKNLKQLQSQLSIINRKLDENKETIKSLYSDKVKGVIDEAQFKELSETFSSEKLGLMKRKDELEAKLNKESERQKEENEVKELAYSVIHLNELDRVILNKLIDKIEIFEDEDIQVHYKFNNPYLE